MITRTVVNKIHPAYQPQYRKTGIIEKGITVNNIEHISVALKWAYVRAIKHVHFGHDRFVGVPSGWSGRFSR